MNVLFIGSINDNTSGYGNAAAGIVRTLEHLRDSAVIDDFSTVDTKQLGSPDVVASLGSTAFDVAILSIYPRFLLQRGAMRALDAALAQTVKAYLSLVWETDRLPEDWMPLLESDLFTGFLAPSYFMLMMIAAATSKRVVYFPHLVEPEEGPDTPRVNDLFTVLYVGQNTARKGLQDAVLAYSLALGKESAARMIVKYHAISDREIEPVSIIHHTARCNLDACSGGIFLTADMVERPELLRLYRSSSLLFCPSRGEGFGLPPAEAMCAGLRVAYTNWSSLPEVCGSPWNYPIDYTLDLAHSMHHYGYDPRSHYAVPKVSSMVETLERAFDEWQRDREAYFSHDRDLADTISERYGMESVVTHTRDVLEV